MQGSEQSFHKNARSHGSVDLLLSGTCAVYRCFNFAVNVHVGSTRARAHATRPIQDDRDCYRTLRRSVKATLSTKRELHHHATPAAFGKIVSLEFSRATFSISLFQTSVLPRCCSRYLFDVARIKPGDEGKRGAVNV